METYEVHTPSGISFDVDLKLVEQCSSKINSVSTLTISLREINYQTAIQFQDGLLVMDQHSLVDLMSTRNQIQSISGRPNSEICG